MKRLFIFGLIIFAFLMASYTLAQNSWDKQLKTLDEGQILKADFTQLRHLNGFPKPIKTNGKILLWSGKGLIWKTVKPFPSAIQITMNGFYQLEEGNRVSLVTSQQGRHEKALFEIISNILKGSFTDIQGFEIETLPDNKKQWKVRLSPNIEQIKKFVSSLEVEGDQYISKVTIYRSNGDYDEIVFTHHSILDNSYAGQLMSVQEKAGFDEK